jgi:hypothetical protein
LVLRWIRYIGVWQELLQLVLLQCWLALCSVYDMVTVMLLHYELECTNWEDKGVVVVSWAGMQWLSLS